MLVCHIGWSTFKLTESQVFTFCKKKMWLGSSSRVAFIIVVPFPWVYRLLFYQLCRCLSNLITTPHDFVDGVGISYFYLPHCSYSGSSSHLNCRVKALNRVGLQCGLSFLVFFLYFLSDCVITRFHRWLCRVIFCNVLVTPQSDL